MPSSDYGVFQSPGTIAGPEPVSDLFGEFFESWLEEQSRDLEDLIVMVKEKTESTRSLSELVGRVIGHYESYYRVKSESVKLDAIRMMTPAWRSHLEDAFLWVGGWRPSMAFHLLYSILGLQVEVGLSELTRGGCTGDLADLTSSQIGLIDALQRQTIKEEKALTETLAAHQETMADSSMVKLSQVATELTRNPNSLARNESLEKRVDLMLAGKEDKLVEILDVADDLRLRTMKDVVEILSPIQAAHFLIAAAELHLRVHEWGKKKDANANA